MFYHKEGFTYVQYADNKRSLKLNIFFIDSKERQEHLALICRFVMSEANLPKHIAKMQPDKFFALVERLSTLFCRSYSPTTNWGITKPEIRGVVYFLLNEAIRVGEWPLYCRINKTTFVQEAGGDDSE